MFAKRRLIPALVVVAGLACSATAMAQPNRPTWGWGQNRAGSQAAYDNGYRAGYDQGQADVRGNGRYGYERHGRYRDGDYGYNSSYGNRNVYRDEFRRGYATGYEQGYNRSGGYSSNRYPNYPDRGGYGSRYPNYPNGGYGGYGYYSEAYDRGMREGAQKGREDAKDGDRYDPRRQKWYRDGDRGYNKRYGSREQYKSEYRDAFERGYAQGYREYGYRGNGNGGLRWPW